jgi:flavorubredoxin
MTDRDDPTGVPGNYFVHSSFPRAIGSGMQWISGCSTLCLEQPQHDLVHGACNTYLLLGTEKTLLIDTSHPALWGEYQGALAKALNGRQLDYVMPTQAKIPYSGSLSMLVEAYPQVLVVGEIRDYFLYHPDVPESAYLPMGPGDKLDLGSGRTFEFIQPNLGDLPSTLWGFDHGLRALFPADGISFCHWHRPGSCAATAEELGALPDPQVHCALAQIGAGLARLDAEVQIRRFEALLVRLHASVIAPAQGTLVTEIATAMDHLQALRNSKNSHCTG